MYFTRAAALFAIILTLTGELGAQQPHGEIRIEVRDPSGAAMAAHGELDNLANGATRTFDTGPGGQWTASNLPYARYRLSVTRSGFAAQSLLIDVSGPAPVSRVINLAVGIMAGHIDVVAATPLAGSGLPALEVPAPVHVVTANDLAATGAVNLAELLDRRLASININQIQGNPFQPDVNYRGYAASPLLGTPQGLAVYLDGMRLNQPFGDVVSWDLIPRAAIDEVTLVSGSNPLYGRNSLGGALAIETGNGFRNPGTELELGGGSFGRKTAQLESGGALGKGLYWFAAANLFFEDGWRDASPSNVRQFFLKPEWQGTGSSLSLGIGYANNSLTGNGLQEQRLLQRDYTSVYTIPDITANRSPFFNLRGRHAFSPGLSMTGNIYYRSIRTATLNGDVNDDSLDQPAGTGNGLLNRTRSNQHSYGFAGQLTYRGRFGSTRHQLTAGSAFDFNRVRFAQSAQLGYLNPDRSIAGTDPQAGGGTGDAHVELRGSGHTSSLYITDAISTGRWTFTLAGRYDRTTVDNRDLLQPLAGPGSLTGSHLFDRLNPAAGLTFSLHPGLNTYFGYSEGSRAPTSIELGCADPNQPCKLPNAMAGDPPLRQVVTRTFEAGLRGGDAESRDHWSLGVFRSGNRDDILFVASTQTGFGYFKNFGRTLRQGLEAQTGTRIGRVHLGGGYTFLDATYQSAETVDGSSNSTNLSAADGLPGTEGVIEIRPGDRIPLLPSHVLKSYAAVQATGRLWLSLDFLAVSRSYARGNENNRSQPDGVYYLGPGSSPGYGVASLCANFRLHPGMELFGQVNNLLDHRYYTAAQLGPAAFTADGTFLAQPLPPIDGEYPLVHSTFYAPGAPRGAWAGIRFRF